MYNKSLFSISLLFWIDDYFFLDGDSLALPDLINDEMGIVVLMVQLVAVVLLIF